MDKSECITWLKILRANLNTFPEISADKKIEALSMVIKLVEQEPNTGHWKSTIDGKPICSECGFVSESKDGCFVSHYCPGCGAKMFEPQEKEGMSRLKIGQEVLIHGYVDEIRRDTVIIRNEGGYFGTDASEVTDIDATESNKVNAQQSEWERDDELLKAHSDGASEMRDILRAEIDRQEKWLLQAGHSACNLDIAFDTIKSLLAEYEDKE